MICIDRRAEGKKNDEIKKSVFSDAETKEYYPIDFDDAMYHRYAMDIEQAVDQRNRLN
jgi:Ser/Thr protein kinase RdoA (MazF antagonist)